MKIQGGLGIMAGTKILCPKCNKEQCVFEQNIHIGQTISYTLLKSTSPLVIKPRMPAISWCCKVPWLNNGALFLEGRGWYPYNPNTTGRPEKHPDLLKKKTFI